MADPELFTRMREATERAVRLRAESETVLADAEATAARLAAEGRSADVAELRAEVAGLRKALESRAVIEQAKGIVMARTGLTPDAAFEVLVRQSQHENRKVREVAAGLVRAAVRPQAGKIREPRPSGG